MFESIMIQQHSPGPILEVALTGSRLWGVATETSDIDVQVVYLTSPRNFWLHGMDHRNKQMQLNNCDVTYNELASFFYGLIRGNINAYEILYSTNIGNPENKFRNVIQSLAGVPIPAALNSSRGIIHSLLKTSLTVTEKTARGLDKAIVLAKALCRGEIPQFRLPAEHYDWRAELNEMFQGTPPEKISPELQTMIEDEFIRIRKTELLSVECETR